MNVGTTFALNCALSTVPGETAFIQEMTLAKKQGLTKCYAPAAASAQIVVLLAQLPSLTFRKASIKHLSTVTEKICLNYIHYPPPYSAKSQESWEEMA